MEKLIISPAPHIHGGDSVAKNMTGVIIALIPALLVGFYFFGLGALIVTLTSVAACVLVEYLIQKFINGIFNNRHSLTICIFDNNIDGFVVIPYCKCQLHGMTCNHHVWVIINNLVTHNSPPAKRLSAL